MLRVTRAQDMAKMLPPLLPMITLLHDAPLAAGAPMPLTLLHISRAADALFREPLMLPAMLRRRCFHFAKAFDKIRRYAMLMPQDMMPRYAAAMMLMLLCC